MRGYARLVWYLSDGLWYPWLRAILSVTLVLCQLYTSLPQATNKFMRTHNIVHKANLYGITHKTIRSYRLNCARRSYAQTEKLCRDKLFCFVWTLGSRFPETIRISDDLASSEGYFKWGGGGGLDQVGGRKAASGPDFPKKRTEEGAALLFVHLQAHGQKSVEDPTGDSLEQREISNINKSFRSFQTSKIFS